MADQHPATDLIVSWWSERFQRDDKRTEFAEALRRRVADEWRSLAEKYPGLTLRQHLEVDYDPSGALLDALHDAGIECRGFMFSANGLLPQKTRMYVYADSIEVVEGYGAPLVTIWRGFQ